MLQTGQNEIDFQRAGQVLHASNLFSFDAGGSAVNETCLRMTLDGNRNDEEALADIHACTIALEQ